MFSIQAQVARRNPRRLGVVVPSMSPHPTVTNEPEPALTIGADLPMSAEQAALLRRLAFDAYEPDAFGPHLMQAEAARRIAMLRAKLKLMDEPPHTL